MTNNRIVETLRSAKKLTEWRTQLSCNEKVKVNVVAIRSVDN